MELPEDVLRIIREYSKPVFPHFREYNQILKIIDHKNKNWINLKDKIGNPEVMAKVKICIAASENARIAREKYLRKEIGWIYDSIYGFANCWKLLCIDNLYKLVNSANLEEDVNE